MPRLNRMDYVIGNLQEAADYFEECADIDNNGGPNAEMSLQLLLDDDIEYLKSLPQEKPHA